ncbi:hypothetical protein QBC40DRAFT_341641 [Triangularia verruculosa]|uniref:Uncharacterized protein n=1 Tax=Triangularia verruculosa TaxID=2587418 RepID=A0AAN6XC58_9PEZI|nr:hypothetical protein QBC40DRAFT_341641 [Triangularia verruculosa]
MTTDREINQNIGDITANDRSTVFAGYNDLSVHVNVDGTILQHASRRDLAEVPPSTVQTALILATGDFGWFKGPQRTQTLVNCLQAKGAELKTIHSFSFQRYKNFRQKHDAPQGTFVDQGVAMPIVLPNALTEVSRAPAMSCLRAITVCLVCLCNKRSTVAILQQLLPYGLLRKEMEDAKLEFEGPLLSSLSQWVDSVIVEEENNKLRDVLMANLDASLRRHIWEKPGDNDDLAIGEEGFILGVLKWAVKPYHERASTGYPTRSLRAWMAASILEQLGFEISAVESVVSTPEDYDLYITNEESFNVFLVVSHRVKVDVDPLAQEDLDSELDDTLPPRAVLLKEIPDFVFRDIEDAHRQQVKDAYNRAFDMAVIKFTDMRVNLSSKLKIDVEMRDRAEGQRVLALLRGSYYDDTGPRYIHIEDKYFIDALEKMIGMLQGPGEDSSNQIGGEKLYSQLGTTAKKDSFFHTGVASALGTLYGICSCACRQGGARLGGDAKISVSPENICRANYQVILQWSHRLMKAVFFGGVSYRDWAGLIFEMFLGHTQDPSQEKTNISNERRTLAHEEYRSPDWVLGVQSHGYNAISDSLVSLKLESSSLGIFHITRGQLLNIPYDSQGYLRGPTDLRPSERLQAEKNYNWIPLRSLDIPTNGLNTQTSLRFDVEPYWEGDPRTIILKVRETGVPIASVYMMQVIHRLATMNMDCECSTSQSRVEVPENEQWLRLSIQDLRVYASKGIKPGKLVDLRTGRRNVMIDASEGPEALAYVLGIIDAHQIKIAPSGCIRCAYIAPSSLFHPKPSPPAAGTIPPFDKKENHQSTLSSQLPDLDSIAINDPSPFTPSPFTRSPRLFNRPRHLQPLFSLMNMNHLFPGYP